jgi:hypothetical protein
MPKNPLSMKQAKLYKITLILTKKYSLVEFTIKAKKLPFPLLTVSSFMHHLLKDKAFRKFNFD